MTRRPSSLGLSRPLGAMLLGVAVLHPAPAGAQPGAIEGSWSVQVGPARKTASRYPAGSVTAKEMQAVAAVVYLADEGLAGGPSPATVDLVQRDTMFAPSTLAVPTGTVVRFPNEDSFFHNVFSYSRNGRFDLGRYPEGESRQVTFDDPGVAHVFCEVHEFMRAVVVVTDHPFHAVVAADGSFRIAGVPAGEHTLVAYHADLGSIERSVVVRAGETLRLTVGPDADPTPAR